MKANDLLKRIREQLGPIADTLRNHPYLASLNSGQVPMEALRRCRAINITWLSATCGPLPP